MEKEWALEIFEKLKVKLSAECGRNKDNSAAAKSHETFYLYYKQRYPNDGVLIKHFGKEYYLNYAERLKFVKDPIERKIAEKTIRLFLEKLENDSGRQHIVLNQLRLAFEGK